MTEVGTGVLAATTDGRFRVLVVPDSDPQNPRTEFDQLAHAVTAPADE
ncbi:hypothetical protein [Kitasatospora sp. NPDC098663]